MVSNVSGADNISVALGAKSSAQKGLDQSFEDFILLLTTQLKNQDPTQPLDTNQITQQIASLSQVQATIDSNSKLDELIALSGGSQLSNVVGYIGRVIEAEGNKGTLISDGESSAALFVYDMPAEAKTATISIFDSTNKLVYSGQALTNEGRNEVVWDGNNNLTNQQMALGAYSFKINAKDFANNDLEVKTYTTGIVTAVDTQGGDVRLSLGSIDVDISAVTAIKTAQELL